MDEINLSNFRNYPVEKSLTCHNSGHLGCAGWILSGLYHADPFFEKGLINNKKIKLPELIVDTIMALSIYYYGRPPRTSVRFKYNLRFTEDRGKPCKILLIGVSSKGKKLYENVGFQTLFVQNNAVGGSTEFHHMGLKIGSRQEPSGSNAVDIFVPKGWEGKFGGRVLEIGSVITKEDLPDNK